MWRCNLGQYRGEFNSAWVGSMMSLIATFFIGWFGFYLVKGSVARDRETGVGQIMATTPLTRPLYTIRQMAEQLRCPHVNGHRIGAGRHSHSILAGRKHADQSHRAFSIPFVFIVMPLMALVAALAVLFESIPFLQGGFGNIVYFFRLHHVPAAFHGNHYS